MGQIGRRGACGKPHSDAKRHVLAKKRPYLETTAMLSWHDSTHLVNGKGFFRASIQYLLRLFRASEVRYAKRSFSQLPFNQQDAKSLVFRVFAPSQQVDWEKRLFQKVFVMAFHRPVRNYLTYINPLDFATPRILRNFALWQRSGPCLPRPPQNRKS